MTRIPPDHLSYPVRLSCEKGNLGFEFKEEEKFNAILIVSIFSPLFYYSDINILIKVLLFTFPVWLIIVFNYKHIRITETHVIGIKFHKPFNKVIKYSINDINKVLIGSQTRYGRGLVIYFKEKMKIRVGLHYNPEEIYIFFADKGINVTTSDSELNNFILHHKNDPIANKKRQEVRRSKRLMQKSTK